MRRYSGAALAALVLAAGCRGAGDGPAVQMGDTAIAVPPPSEFGGGAPAYRVIALSRPGRVLGTVEIDADHDPDTLINVTNDTQACGTAFVDSTTRTSQGRLADVVVWLRDARTGKQVPLTRRFELEHRRCRLVPRVQAVIAGGTLNLRSSDRVVHPARFIRVQDSTAIAVVTEHDDGQVIPLEHVLSVPGRVEVRCDLHPWTRAWLLAFDHPYFDVTDREGGFTIDSIPPGRYRIVAWHERFGMVEEPVVIAADSATRVALRLRE